MADVQQLNSRTLPRQALEGKLYVGETFELDLNIQTVSGPGGLPSVSSGFSLQSKSFNLLSKGSAMLIPILGRNLWTSAAAPLAVRLGFGNVFENEVAVPFLIAVRHAVPVSFGFPFLLISRSAMLLRSASIFRMSVSCASVRRWISASFSTSFAARVTSA